MSRRIIILRYSSPLIQYVVPSFKPLTCGRAVGVAIRAMGFERYDSNTWKFQINPPLKPTQMQTFLKGVRMGLMENIDSNIVSRTPGNLESMLHLLMLNLKKTEDKAHYVADEGPMPINTQAQFSDLRNQIHLQMAEMYNRVNSWGNRPAISIPIQEGQFNHAALTARIQELETAVGQMAGKIDQGLQRYSAQTSQVISKLSTDASSVISATKATF